MPTKGKPPPLQSVMDTAWGPPTDAQRASALESLLHHPSTVVRIAAEQALIVAMAPPANQAAAAIEVVRVILLCGAYLRAGYSMDGVAREHLVHLVTSCKLNVTLANLSDATLDAAVQAAARPPGRPLKARGGSRAEAIYAVFKQLKIPIQSSAALEKMIKRNGLAITVESRNRPTSGNK